MRWHWHPPPFSLTSTGQYSNNLLCFASDHHFLNLPLRSLDDRQHEWMRTQDPYSRMWVEIENWFELLREFSFFPKLTHSIPSVPLCHKVPVWWHVFTFLSYYFYIAWHKQKKKKAFPHASGQILLPMPLVRLLHKWNHRLIPKIWIHLTYIHVTNLEVPLEWARLSLLSLAFHYSLE